MSVTPQIQIPGNILYKMGAFYEFEPGRFLTDSTGYGLNLTNNNAATQINTSPKVGNYAHFVRASSQSLSHVHHTNLSVNGDFTVMAWLYPATFTNIMNIASKRGGGTYSWALNNESGDIWFYVYDSSANSTYATITISPSGTWYFIVGTYTASDKKVRLSVNNGAVTVASTALTNPADTGASSDFSIGGLEQEAAWFSNDNIDQVGIWQRVLTAAEITILSRGLSYAQMVALASPPTPFATALKKYSATSAAAAAGIFPARPNLSQAVKRASFY
jgi:hypothetical protein